MTDRRSHLLQTRASSRLAHDASPGASGGTLDSARELAASALDRAAGMVRELRHGVSDKASAAQWHAGRYAGATTRYVAERPVRSALIAAAVGAAVMAAILVARRNNRRY